MPNIVMGDRDPYALTASDTPGPGTYDADISIDRIKPSTRSVGIHEELHKQRRIGDNPPHVYDSHLRPFGSDVNDRAIWGSRRNDTVNEVPPPGYYDPNDVLTHPRSPDY